MLAVVVTVVIVIAGAQAWFDLNVRQYPRSDNASVVISTNGTNFIPVQTWTSDVYAGHEVLDLSAQLAGQAAFHIGFRYTDGNNCAALPWHIDDVKVYGY